MARDGIDLSELDEFSDRLIQSSKEADKAQRKFLRQQGSKLARKTRAKARAKVNKTEVVRKKYTREAGQYHKSIKRGKLVVRGNDRHIRVYSNDKIGHLIEDGWTPKFRDGTKGSFQSGKHVFEETREEFEPEYERACEEAIDEMISKI